MDKEQQRGLGGNARVWQLGDIYKTGVKVIEGIMPPCFELYWCFGSMDMCEQVSTGICK